MSTDKIIIRGARENNLKNIDLELPRDQLIVITGLSGSGKSSLAFDTIYAEGQRRYVESLSAYARQFLGQMDKPDVDYIEGLSPAISIDQKSASKNPRSTVGTVTEIYDYLRLLYARVGRPHCHKCGRPIAGQSIDQMVDAIMAYEPGTRFAVLGPVVRGRKGEYARLFDTLRRSGYVRVRMDGEVRELDETIILDKNKQHTIEVVIDRLIVKPGIESRLADSLERALELADGLAVIHLVDKDEQVTFSQNLSCPDCGVSVEELTPRMFSFNSPYGACPHCHGLGERLEVDPDLVIPDRGRSLSEGAIAPWEHSSGTYYIQLCASLAEAVGFDMDTPVRDLSVEQLDALLYGMSEPITFRYENKYGRQSTWRRRFEGVIPLLERRYAESTSEAFREHMQQFMTARTCLACGGKRLRPEALAVTVGGKSIAEMTRLTVSQAVAFLDSLTLTALEQQIARQIIREIKARLGFLEDVGLSYLTCDRSAGSLAGGEAQRIRLATQIGSSLVGVLYILDEPSIGLHQRDNDKLIRTLKRLRDLGNTLIVVEHDEETIWAADHVVDIGPGAGRHGGYIVAQGTPAELADDDRSITGQYLSGKRTIAVPEGRRPTNDRWLVVKGAHEHNLKNIDVAIPLGVFTCVTGVSGSGKSTLVNEILYHKLVSTLHRARLRPGEHDEVLGIEHLDKVINIDQSPIGRTPRSNPATYTGAFDHIRELFALTPEARARGYKPGRFSFNVRGGRCEACRGDGTIKIEMHFLPDVYVTCDVCRGTRYNRETMEIRYRGKTIADVLDMTIDEALEFFQHIPQVSRKLQTMADVGLGYLRLGQPATTLSGGEAQRIKLASELSRRSNGRTIYILDEPTTGLHMADVHRLLDVLQRLVDAGNTVLVIEHNLDVIKCADWLIDLGPDGGEHGGQVVCTGTPEQVAQCPASYTGQYLKRVLDRARDRASRLSCVAGGMTGEAKPR